MTDQQPATEDPRAALLAEACRVFGINPDPELRPLELAAHKFYGSAELLEPMSVSLVTAGGLKIRYPIDAATEYRLRYNVFKAHKTVRNGWSEQHVELPLPADLRLPRVHLTGQVPAQG